jgi:hypothetical protein
MELVIWSAVCALIGLGCMGGAAWAILGGEDVGVERIFLVLVWMLFAALFLGMAAWIAKVGPLRSMGKKAAAETEQDKESVERAAP